MKKIFTRSTLLFLLLLSIGCTSSDRIKIQDINFDKSNDLHPSFRNNSMDDYDPLYKKLIAYALPKGQEIHLYYTKRIHYPNVHSIGDPNKARDMVMFLDEYQIAKAKKYGSKFPALQKKILSDCSKQINSIFNITYRYINNGIISNRANSFEKKVNCHSFGFDSSESAFSSYKTVADYYKWDNFNDLALYVKYKDRTRAHSSMLERVLMKSSLAKVSDLYSNNKELLTFLLKSNIDYTPANKRDQVLYARLANTCTMNDKRWQYSGKCLRKLAHGKGEANHFDSKVSFKGEFRKGSFLSGTLYNNSRPDFIGLFKANKPNGAGTCFYNGQEEKCKYKNNRRIDPIFITRANRYCSSNPLPMESLESAINKLKTSCSSKFNSYSRVLSGVYNGSARRSSLEDSSSNLTNCTSSIDRHFTRLDKQRDKISEKNSEFYCKKTSPVRQYLQAFNEAYEIGDAENEKLYKSARDYVESSEDDLEEHRKRYMRQQDAQYRNSQRQADMSRIMRGISSMGNNKAWSNFVNKEYNYGGGSNTASGNSNNSYQSNLSAINKRLQNATKRISTSITLTGKNYSNQQSTRVEKPESRDCSHLKIETPAVYMYKYNSFTKLCDVVCRNGAKAAALGGPAYCGVKLDQPTKGTVNKK